MRELTEREEREMIDRAKAGDPVANYNMSLWALDRAIADPGDDRWNRLAAKCLVRSAEAGYEPARIRMDDLLRQTQPTDAPAQPIREQPIREQPIREQPIREQPIREQPRPQPVREQPQPRPAPEPKPAPKNKPWPDAVEPDPAPAKKKRPSRLSELMSRRGRQERGDAGTPEAPEASAAGTDGSARPRGQGAVKGRLASRFSNWTDEEWKNMRRVCIVAGICVVVLIVVLILTGRSAPDRRTQVLPTPETQQAEPSTPTPSPTPEPYPDAAVRAEIAAASLQVQPAETDYVEKETTSQVKTNGGDLNLRGGPASSYTQLASIPNGTSLPVYAFKNGWALVKYNDSWGWCSGDYLSMG